jgi:hypothetical protein
VERLLSVSAEVVDITDAVCRSGGTVTALTPEEVVNELVKTIAVEREPRVAGGYADYREYGEVRPGLQVEAPQPVGVRDCSTADEEDPGKHVAEDPRKMPSYVGEDSASVTWIILHLDTSDVAVPGMGAGRCLTTDYMVST